MKTTGKPGPDGERSKDLRRAYEHLGRVQSLHALLDPAAAGEIGAITRVAQAELAAGEVKDAAELLRAAEHLSFGAIGAAEEGSDVEATLQEAIAHEVGHKLGKADEKWKEGDEHGRVLGTTYRTAVDRAKRAFAAGAYRRALELARGAEALARARVHDRKHLGAGQSS